MAHDLAEYYRLARRWNLTENESLILLAVRDAACLRSRDPMLSPDTQERLSYLRGIDEALHMLFTDDQQADGWVRRPNTTPLFDGRSALEYMLDGQRESLRLVREYLLAQAVGP